MIEELFQKFDDRAPAVRTRGLCKRFGTQTALDGLEMTVPEGSVYVLVGPNGAGKTTTFRALLDLTVVDDGAAEVFGLPCVERGAEVRARIGFVPDSQQFPYGSLPVDALLSHHATYYPDWDEAYAGELKRKMSIDGGQRYGGLSKGEARRVQLVMALAHRPPLLLMDEPTDGLDPLAQDRFQALLADHLADTSTTVVISTHRVHEVEGLGDCLGVLRDGRLVAQLDRQRLDHLVRIRAEVPEGWTGGSQLPVKIIRRGGHRREIAWTVWGGSDEATAAFAGAGATVRQVERLTLEEATRALLAMEEPS
jgi:ABC-2 type transport system ATP-binding protein